MTAAMVSSIAMLAGAPVAAAPVTVVAALRSDHDSAVAAVGELRRLLSDEAGIVDSLVVTPDDPTRSQNPVS